MNIKNYGMNNTGKTVELGAIIFESNDPEVLVKGAVRDGVFSYITEYIINHTQLNKLINQIQKLNDDTDVNKLIQREDLYNGNILYSADLSILKNKSLNLGELFNLTALKKIRA